MTRSILPVDIQVRDFIRDYKLTHGGDSPTFREIMNGTAASSTSHVSAILNKLDAAGLIRIEVGRHIYLPELEIICTGQPLTAELEY